MSSGVLAARLVELRRFHVRDVAESSPRGKYIMNLLLGCYNAAKLQHPKVPSHPSMHSGECPLALAGCAVPAQHSGTGRHSIRVPAGTAFGCWACTAQPAAVLAQAAQAVPACPIRVTSTSHPLWLSFQASCAAPRLSTPEPSHRPVSSSRTQGPLGGLSRHRLWAFGYRPVCTYRPVRACRPECAYPPVSDMLLCGGGPVWRRGPDIRTCSCQPVRLKYRWRF